jgi:hypothetical protein
MYQQHARETWFTHPDNFLSLLASLWLPAFLAKMSMKKLQPSALPSVQLTQSLPSSH